MNTVCRSLLCVLVLLVLLGSNAQAQRRGIEVTRDRLDNLLPNAMRQNDVDMWIHVLPPWNPFGPGVYTDPLLLGTDSGYCIFTDRGGDRIERALFSYNDDVQDAGAYDIVEVIENGERRFANLRQFVATRDPERIGVNFSDRLPFSDGISHEEYTLLVDAIGETYAKRTVTADILITDYLSGKVVSELVRFGQSDPLLEERMGRFEGIEPGVTALSDVPGVSVRNRERREGRQNDYIIQRGDDLAGAHFTRAYIRRLDRQRKPC